MFKPEILTSRSQGVLLEDDCAPADNELAEITKHLVVDSDDCSCPSGDLTVRPVQSPLPRPDLWQITPGLYRVPLTDEHEPDFQYAGIG